MIGTSLLEFEAINFFLGIRQHGRGLYLTLIFFQHKPQIFQGNRKVNLTNCLETNFHNISNISLRVISRRNYS